ncbi:hypothetical protein [Streptomyces sp. S465]|uniref:hypothetical protein n=1 Tax=Streptomyces sp. S465 TaxID=2979468 RepID=UPI0022A83DB7|nr:hypothetical protein [Streptomyces sp. S465]WAP61124.1 hypothetical protein N6H00_34955 [Streptomyces sp. S465]
MSANSIMTTGASALPKASGSSASRRASASRAPERASGVLVSATAELWDAPPDGPASSVKARTTAPTAVSPAATAASVRLRRRT